MLRGRVREFTVGFPKRKQIVQYNKIDHVACGSQLRRLPEIAGTVFLVWNFCLKYQRVPCAIICFKSSKHSFQTWKNETLFRLHGNTHFSVGSDLPEGQLRRAWEASRWRIRSKNGVLSKTCNIILFILEHKLHDHIEYILKSNYNKLVRPARNRSRKFPIHLVLLPQTLIKIVREKLLIVVGWCVIYCCTFCSVCLQESNLQHMVITGYLTVVSPSYSVLCVCMCARAQNTLPCPCVAHQEWLDEFIHWEPSNFGGTKEIQFSEQKLWRPTLSVFNALGHQAPLHGYTKNLFLYRRNNATRVRMYIKEEFYTSCSINILKFPNDRQECSINIISLDGLHHDQRQLMQFKLLQKNTKKTWILFSKHSAWHLYNATQMLFDVLDRKVYSYTLYFHRNSHFYFINIIGPLIILSFMSHVVYILPPNNIQRINIGVAVFISYTVFMLLIQNILPKSIQMPHISKWSQSLHQTKRALLKCAQLRIARRVMSKPIRKRITVHLSIRNILQPHRDHHGHVHV